MRIPFTGSPGSISAEPQVFSHPDMGKRSTCFEMVDLWMTVFNSPGRPQHQRQGRRLPDHRARLDRHIPGRHKKQIKCATRYMVILGRTYADGTDQDYAAVNALRAQSRGYRLACTASLRTPTRRPRLIRTPASRKRRARERHGEGGF